MVNDHYPYEKWLFHWGNIPYFQTYPIWISALPTSPLTMAWNGRATVVSTSCTGPVREQIGIGDQRDHR